MTVSTRIRITLSEIEQVRNVPGIEARFGDEHIAMSVFRFDSEMLVTPHLARLVGHDSPMMHLRRYQDDGLFDRFGYHTSETSEGRSRESVRRTRTLKLGNPLCEANDQRESMFVRGERCAY
ncbi:hypothetical protein [Streptosporangium sp. V21-05]|uniref:hypothetical protein n=1 Tax=Streptosporangium sp. V21-05 TaxID=3446115 RepID=UPI003F537DC0